MLALEKGLSVSPLDVSKSQGTENKWGIANMLISFTLKHQSCVIHKSAGSEWHVLNVWGTVQLALIFSVTWKLFAKKKFQRLSGYNQNWIIKVMKLFLFTSGTHSLFDADWQEFFEASRRNSWPAVHRCIPYFSNMYFVLPLPRDA